MLALALLAGTGIVVVEARVGDEPSHAALGNDIATRLSALPPAAVSARIAANSSPLAIDGRVEPILEADRLVEKGKDDYLEGHFAEAIEQLERARGLMSRALESIEEERQTAEALFRAELYLAFTLRAQGAVTLARARDVMKEAIRSFPTLEPSMNEYGPENVRFFAEVKKELEHGPTSRLRVGTVGPPANVYLNGRLVGVTPIDLRRVYVGRYRMHLRRGSENSRVHWIEIKEGTNEFSIDVGFDAAIHDDTPTLNYSSAMVRAEQAWPHASRLAAIVGVDNVVVYWVSEGTVTLALVDRDGGVRTVTAPPAASIDAAVGLRDGRLGTIVRSRENTPRKRVWAWIVGGVAVGALVAAIVLGNSFQSDLDTLNQKYPNGNVTDPRDLTLRDDARAKGDAANVLYGVAGAAAIGSILLYYFEGSEHPRRAALVPTLAPTFAGATWRIEF